MSKKTYSGVLRFNTLEERFNYLYIGGKVGEDTFASHRYLNQMLYKCHEWRKITRPQIILRDKGYELGLEEDYCKFSDGQLVIVHHINPITIEDVLNREFKVFDPENLICCSLRVHNAIHYGSVKDIPEPLIERAPGDTCPWK